MSYAPLVFRSFRKSVSPNSSLAAAMAKVVRCCIMFLVAFLLSMKEIHARSMPKLPKDDNDSDEDIGSSSIEEQKGDCFYNGKWYVEGEHIPTGSLCLVCTCHKEFTEPSIFTCAVKDCPWGLYETKYRGCTPVYSSTECCPVDWKCDSTSDELTIKHRLNSPNDEPAIEHGFNSTNDELTIKHGLHSIDDEPAIKHGFNSTNDEGEVAILD